MGTDINILVQTFNGTTWRSRRNLVEEGRTDPECRAYSTFGFLSGVRVEHSPTPLADRGIPDDLLHETDDDGWVNVPGSAQGLGYHNLSWGTYAEFMSLDWTDLDPRWGEYPMTDSQFYKWLVWLKPHADEVGHENLRIIFGYDS